MTKNLFRRGRKTERKKRKKHGKEREKLKGRTAIKGRRGKQSSSRVNHILWGPRTSRKKFGKGVFSND